MSRIGRLPIDIPAGVDVTIDGAAVTVKGPKGTLNHTIPAPLTASVEEGKVVVFGKVKGRGSEKARVVRRKVGALKA